MRLIDVDKLPRHGGRGGIVHWSDIKKAPTVDAVPVIRCKDCKQHFYGHDGIPCCANIDYGYGWRDEDYCSYAERKEE